MKEDEILLTGNENLILRYDDDGEELRPGGRSTGERQHEKQKQIFHNSAIILQVWRITLSATSSSFLVTSLRKISRVLDDNLRSPCAGFAYR